MKMRDKMIIIKINTKYATLWLDIKRTKFMDWIRYHRIMTLNIENLPRWTIPELENALRKDGFNVISSNE